MKLYFRDEAVRDIMLILFIGILLIMFFAACSRQAVPVIASSDTVRLVTVKEVVKDTTLYIDDLGGWSAWAECDSLGQITLRQLEIERGRLIVPTVKVRNNYIKSECVIDSGAVYMSWKERHTTEAVSTDTVVVKRENYLTGWQWFQVWSGRILAGLVVLVVVWWFVRRRLPP